MTQNVIIDGNNFSCIAASTCLKSKLVGQEFEELLAQRLQMMLRSLQTRLYGTYYVCFDTYGGTSFRKEIDSNYKATRDHSLFDYEAIENTKILYEMNGVKSISIPECEGDDAIFSLCQYLKKTNPQNANIIVSRDMDMIQIVQKNLAKAVYNPVAKAFVEIPFYSIIDFKALCGDTSDNIPGAKGIGKARALKVLSGELKLTEEQQAQFDTNKKLVDLSLNPYLESNYNYLSNLLCEKD